MEKNYSRGGHKAMERGVGTMAVLVDIERCFGSVVELTERHVFLT